MGSAAILMFNTFIFSFQNTHCHLNVVPVPLRSLGILFGKIQFFKLALLILVNYTSRKSLFKPCNNVSLTTAYYSISGSR